MDQSAFHEQHVLEPLRRDLKLGRLQANIDEARENLANVPPVGSPADRHGTKRMLANRDLHYAMAALMRFERGLA